MYKYKIFLRIISTMILFVLHTLLAVSAVSLTLVSVFCIIILAGSTVIYKTNTKRLREAKAGLERIVEERTAALRHKEQEVMDSIRYALRIQLSIIPTAIKVKSLLPKSMVLYKPKDIVSGDFYWVDEVDGKVLFAAVDCTGHGVPGAMMSVIGLKSLNQATQDKKLLSPADILQHLDAEVNNTLRQSYDPNAVKDGMDLALCSIDYKTLTLEYAGVFNSLWLLRKGVASSHTLKSDRELFYGTDLFEIKADKSFIGNNKDGVADVFTNHSIQLQKDDCVYIFTDGYADQFGGPNGKKFKYNKFKDLLIANAHLTMDDQYNALNKAFMDWKGNLEQVDDVLVIGVKI
jgi:serine phosphatase RsbU (regulator of sigma subunit)